MCPFCVRRRAVAGRSQRDVLGPNGRWLWSRWPPVRVPSLTLRCGASSFGGFADNDVACPRCVPESARPSAPARSAGATGIEHFVGAGTRLLGLSPPAVYGAEGQSSNPLGRAEETPACDGGFRMTRRARAARTFSRLFSGSGRGRPCRAGRSRRVGSGQSRKRSSPTSSVTSSTVLVAILSSRSPGPAPAALRAPLAAAVHLATDGQVFSLTLAFMGGRRRRARW